jgi:hypothetical protein
MPTLTLEDFGISRDAGQEEIEFELLRIAALARGVSIEELRIDLEANPPPPFGESAPVIPGPIPKERGWKPSPDHPHHNK